MKTIEITDDGTEITTVHPPRERKPSVRNSREKVRTYWEREFELAREYAARQRDDAEVAMKKSARRVGKANNRWVRMRLMREHHPNPVIAESAPRRRY